MKRNHGFSLVELMVAMVVGLIIILGAGQLLLTVFQTNRQIELLSEKQSALNFAVESIVRDVRKADLGGGVSCYSSDNTAELAVKVEEECHFYKMENGDSHATLMAKVGSDDWQSVVDAFSIGSSVSPSYSVPGGSVFLFSLDLKHEKNNINFRVVNRTNSVEGKSYPSD